MKTIAFVVASIVVLEVFTGCASDSNGRVGANSDYKSSLRPIAAGPSQDAYRPPNPLASGISY